jgi:hypothetical protein
VELLFSTHRGSVLAMAELLRPCSAAPIGLQPFRFIAMDSAESRKLGAAITSSQKTEAESPSAPPRPRKPANWRPSSPDTLAIVHD